MSSASSSISLSSGGIRITDGPKLFFGTELPESPPGGIEVSESGSDCSFFSTLLNRCTVFGTSVFLGSCTPYRDIRMSSEKLASFGERGVSVGVEGPEIPILLFFSDDEVGLGRESFRTLSPPTPKGGGDESKCFSLLSLLCLAGTGELLGLTLEVTVICRGFLLAPDFNAEEEEEEEEEDNCEADRGEDREGGG